MNVPSPLVTLTRLELDFFISSDQWQGAYDRLEVWRSRSTANGPYEPLTGDTWAPAVLPVGFVGAPPSPPQTGPSLSLAGKTAQFLLGGQTPIQVLFGHADPNTLADAAASINAAASGFLFSYVFGNTLVVQTVQAGQLAMLQCVGDDAAPLLGFSTDPSAVAFGLDARPVLKQGVENYSFVDVNGSSSFFYKIRFFNSVTRVTSEFSLPFQGPSAPQVPATGLVRCFVDLVDAQGRGSKNDEVLFYIRFTGSSSGGFTAAQQTVKLLTDSNGHAEAMLLRGALVTVAIGGTDLARDVVVPTDPSIVSINLLDPSIGTDDLFTVSVPKLDFATRRTL